MKQFILTLSVLFGAQAFALNVLPDGHWTGVGSFSNDKGQTGSYDEELTVSHNVTTSVLTIGGEKSTYVMKHEFKANGFTQVVIEDQRRGTTLKGSGYCGTVWCHVQADDGSFEMTYVFEENQVYELGLNVAQGVKGWFESTLTRK